MVRSLSWSCWAWAVMSMVGCDAFARIGRTERVAARDPLRARGGPLTGASYAAGRSRGRRKRGRALAF
jgi:hypothetical protein